MSRYTSGVVVERAVVHSLKANGYDVARAAGSKGGLGDVVGVNDHHIVLCNVKARTMPGPAERADLVRVASRLPGVALPVVALGPASNVRYRLLLGAGPKDWTAWSPERAA